jgi:hypothetical protein
MRYDGISGIFTGLDSIERWYHQASYAVSMIVPVRIHILQTLACTEVVFLCSRLMDPVALRGEMEVGICSACLRYDLIDRNHVEGANRREKDRFKLHPTNSTEFLFLLDM